MQVTPRKDQDGHKHSRFQKFNRKMVWSKMLVQLLLKMKKQKIEQENFSLHTPLTNSFLSNFISVLITLTVLIKDTMKAYFSYRHTGCSLI